MSIRIFTGLPGSGKSKRLIELVNDAVAKHRPVLTFACSESPWLLSREYVRVHRILGCRQRGLTCPINHFVSTNECATILDHTSAGVLVAFDEAFLFGDTIAPQWVTASQRGVDVVIVTPSQPQLAMLKGHDFAEETLTMKCQKCFVATANSSIVLPGKDETMSLCQACNQAMTDAARREVLDRLERQAPYPGEKVIYQPIELEECATWRQLRPDSKDRVDLMTRIVRESGLPKSDTYGHSTYLDVGCNTGYFCHQMRRLGFYAEGVDVVEGDIEVARQLDSFFRKDHNNYVIADAYNYLRDTQDRHIDVTSAFAVFQWLMIQTSIERGIECLKWLFAKTNRVCFLEMGYASEAQYKDKLPENIDRTWVWQKMEQLGEFAEIRMYDAKKHGLMFGTRDLFVGIKLPKPEHG